jgi:hypothetical protein
MAVGLPGGNMPDPQNRPPSSGGGNTRAATTRTVATPATPPPAGPPAQTIGFWNYLVTQGAIQGDPAYYANRPADDPEVQNALAVANAHFAAQGQTSLWHHLVTIGAIAGDPNYYTGAPALGDGQHAIEVTAGHFGDTTPVAGTPVTPAPAPVQPGPNVDVPPVTLTNVTIPQGASLVRVTNPAGSDAAQLNYLTYTFGGVDVAFEIGDDTELARLFPDAMTAFASITTVNQGDFDTLFVAGGTLEDSGLLGATESIGSQFERDLRSLAGEGLAEWVRASPDLMRLTVLASTQGWSAAKFWTEAFRDENYEGLNAAKARFGAIDIYTSVGLGIADAVDAYLVDEAEFRDQLRRFRGGTGDTSNSYIARVMQTGWTPATAGAVLEAEDRLRRNPEALAQANEILLLSGLEPVDEAGFLGVMAGSAPPEVTEALNTAFAAQALSEAGIEGVDLGLLVGLVDDTSRLRSAEDFRQVAVDLAANFAKFGTELDRSAYGIGEDDVTAALFGRESPSGRSAGDVLNTLARFARDRQAGAGGFAGASSFIDNRNRLRLQGFGSL